MTTTDNGRPAGQLHWLFGLVLLGTALSPLSTKVAGAAWLLLCVLGLWAGLRAGRQSNPDVVFAATAWLLACLAALGAWTTLSWIWNEPCCGTTADLNAGLRLLLAAVASWVLARHVTGMTRWRWQTNVALTAAGVTALALTLVIENRDGLPSNPIPWAGAISFLVCLLWPSALDRREAPRARWVWGLGSIAGVCAVLLSESRGAYAILLWLPLLAAAVALRRHGRHGRRTAFALLLALAAILGTFASLPSDSFRFRKAWNEVDHALKTADYNTSLGSRVFLFQLAWQGFRESPWIGLGATESIRRIKTAGKDLPAPQAAKLEWVRGFGHPHNQYLHHALNGGLLGLGGLLALMVGIAVAAGRLGRMDRVARAQLLGLMFMHGIASLSNVNFAHNYYVVMLSLSIGLVLLTAKPDQSDAASPTH